MWSECPHRWRLTYIDKIKEPDFSIHSLFGDVVHNIIQNWLIKLYTVSVKESNSVDFEYELRTQMFELYTKIKDEQNNSKNWLEKEQLIEFYSDGLSILDFLKKHRLEYFDRRCEELIGIELPLKIQLSGNGPIFTAYLDGVFLDLRTRRIIIRDLKTSTRGWNDWDKRNETKISQLLLYKVFFSQQYNVPIDNIDVEYYIFRRKTDVTGDFPPKRLQTFRPAQKTPSYSKAIRNFNLFIADGFDNGEYKMKEYLPMSSKKSCTFCPFIDNDVACPKNKRICI